jgi:hypothetical protein
MCLFVIRNKWSSKVKVKKKNKTKKHYVWYPKLKKIQQTTGFFKGMNLCLSLSSFVEFINETIMTQLYERFHAEISLSPTFKIIEDCVQVYPDIQ